MIVTPFTHEPTHKTVWDVRPNGNVFPGLTVWDVHKNGNVFLGLTVCDIHKNGNVFLGFTVWDVHTNENNWVSMPRPIEHELILPQPVCQEGLSPTVSGSCGKDPPIAHTHLATVPNAVAERRSEERRVGKECRSRWSPYH